MKYIVEMTEQENTYLYTGEWDSDFYGDFIIAETEDEAIEIAMDYLRDNGVDPDDYIFRAKETEKLDVLEIRKQSGLSRVEFCRKYEIPTRTYDDWEHGRRHAPEYVLKLLDRAVKDDFGLSD